MPDLIDHVFQRFAGRPASSFYNVTRLDPAYRIELEDAQSVDVPGTVPGLLRMADSLGPRGSSTGFRVAAMFADAEEKYDQGVYTCELGW